MTGKPTNFTQTKELRKKTDHGAAKVAEEYARINREAAAVMNNDDKIVFLPAEDFEYKAPLEDFRKSDKYKAP